MQPSFVSLVKDPAGKVLLDQKVVSKPVLDPRVDYIMVSMLEEVMRTGTAAGVRSRGFTVPAAGKTGTSGGERDGWFAGFTSNLLCLVWVGFDDNRELDIEGARSALPIWTEFMKRATTLRRYADVKEFEAPSGVVTVTIDPESGMPATPQCPMQQPEVFIAGTEPVGMCPLHGPKGGANSTTVTGWDTTPAPAQPPFPPPPAPYSAGPNSATPARRDNISSAVPGISQPAAPPPAPQDQPKKKGFFGKLKDVFR